ncbi:MAG: hypothetical protein GX020_03800 [Firmicutes bacterium]|nr:hypothetical protein [Bacillota bacterium]
MAQLTQSELNTIRELIGPAITNKRRFGFYANQTNDGQVRQVCQHLSSSCDNKVKTLLGFMG